MDDFYVVARESGWHTDPLPVWTDRPGAVRLDDAPEVRRVEVDGVPGAFQLLGVLSADETARLRHVAETLGFHPDSPVSLPRTVRHNDNLNWVVSDDVQDTLWSRSAPFVHERVGQQVARGLNGRFRFYRYGLGDYFSPHTDGAWPGSRVVDQRLVRQADPSLFSQYTYLVFLTDDFEGGETEFFVRRDDPTRPAPDPRDARRIRVRTPAGGVLCFPHGTHPLHCVHGSAPVTDGRKIIIRTDILFGPEVSA
jgi:predicted 2-oxoglutarate/Fe(II)-dependent dioxygenase YbiX